MTRRILAGLILFALVTLDVLVGGPLTRLDRAVSDALLSAGIPNQGPGREGWRFLDLLVLFGDKWVAVPVGTLVLAVVAWRHRTAEPLVRLAVLGAATVVTVVGLKIGIAHPPPPGIQEVGPPRSYPSGHTATAIVLWTLVASCVTGRARPYARVLAWVAPLVTGVCMVLRDYHWVSDVLGAAALGVVLVLAEREALAHWRRARGTVGAASGPARPARDLPAPDRG